MTYSVTVTADTPADLQQRIEELLPSAAADHSPAAPAASPAPEPTASPAPPEPTGPQAPAAGPQV